MVISPLVVRKGVAGMQIILFFIFNTFLCINEKSQGDVQESTVPFLCLSLVSCAGVQRHACVCVSSTPPTAVCS